MKIGVFDSGVGGLTVLKELIRQLPGHSFCYLGDTARVPYGTKSAVTVGQYALEAATFLVEEQQVEMLVVACNTASSVAIEALRTRFPVPVFGVVEPGARQAVAVSRNQCIGVVGTEGTIKTDVYRRALLACNPQAEIVSAPCPLFVPLAEEGWARHPVAGVIAGEYLAPLVERGIDTLVLGCTHYPLLRATLEQVLPAEVALVDSARAVAAEVAALVSPGQEERAAEAALTFCVTDVPDRFVRVGSAFWGAALPEVRQVQLPACISRPVGVVR